MWHRHCYIVSVVKRDHKGEKMFKLVANQTSRHCHREEIFGTYNQAVKAANRSALRGQTATVENSDGHRLYTSTT